MNSHALSPPDPTLRRLNGLRVAHDTVWRGLQIDGQMVRSVDGADIATWSFNRRRSYVLGHPEYVDHVLYGGVEKYHKSIEYEMLRAAVGLSLFTDEDESWRRHRMMINPVLAKRHLASMFDLMVDPVAAFVGRMGSGARSEIEMSEAMTELTLDIVGSALFGRGMADLARKIGPTVTTGLRAAERATRLMLVSNPPTALARAAVFAIRRAPLLPPPLDQLHDVLKTVDDTVWGVIHDRRRGADGRSDDLLGLLLSVRDEHGEPLPLRRVRDEAATFMLAGHETTANAMSWMWFLLAINHQARERMLAEVDGVLAGRRPVLADIERLPWTAACFLEAMRLFPPAWIIPRIAVQDDVIGGHRIRKGSTVIIPIHAIQHDARFWPEPEVFDPARFLPENAKAHHRASYLPFGAGRRVCAGRAFAVMEGTLVTAMMSQQFIFDVLPGFPVEPEATFTLRPRHGMRMIARRRQPTSAQPVPVAA